MKSHTLFFSKIRKDVAKFAYAAVVVGVLRVNQNFIVNSATIMEGSTKGYMIEQTERQREFVFEKHCTPQHYACP